MKKFIIYTLIAVLFALLVASFFKKDNSFKDLKQNYKETIKTNDSLMKINDSLKTKNKLLDKVSYDLESRVDSLEFLVEFKKHEPCPERLRLEKELTNQLKQSLAVCKEQNAIQTIRYSNLESINVNNEVVLVECMNAIEVVENKTWWQKWGAWAERIGWIALITLLFL